MIVRDFLTEFLLVEFKMKTLHLINRVIGIVLLGYAATSESFAADEDLKQDVLMRSLVDELERSMSLKLEDLDQPYFVQYSAADQTVYTISADGGAVFRSGESRSRILNVQVRVGSYDLDNSNFTGGGGFRGRGGGGGRRSLTRVSLPVEDDYIAIRHAIWLATDRNYKQAVETLTRKRAYLEEKNETDRPADFMKTAPVRNIEPKTGVPFDRKEWEAKLREISGHVQQRFVPQDMSLSLNVTVQNKYLVNSEGTRMRRGDIGTVLNVDMQIQAEDGERFSDERSYHVRTPGDLPDIASVKAELETMAEQLSNTLKVPVLENYTGPVLFEGVASAQMFHQLLGRGLAGSPDPIGTRRRGGFGGSANLNTYLGRRILPRSFQIYDHPQIDAFPDVFLAGRYRYDDEGVEARRVDLVENGTLRSMVMSRTPAKKLSESTGHGRTTGFGGSPGAQVGCLFIESNDSVSDAELKQNLLEEAGAQGLDFALKITSLGGGATGTAKDGMAFFGRSVRGPGGSLPDPLFAFKVYVDDGREEMVRGCQFGQITMRALRDIIAAGDTQYAFNQINPNGFAPPSSIITPSVIFEEMDLTQTEPDRDKRPFLTAPAAR